MAIKSAKKDVYQMVTDRIIEQLENNIIPWKKTWSVKHTGSELCNYVTKKPYRGINVLLLGWLQFEQPYFLTFNQAKNLGGNVKKGEKSQFIVFWTFLFFDAEGKKTTDEKKAVKKVPYLNYYNVFNVSQIEGIEFEFPEVQELAPVAIYEECESLINDFENKPKIQNLPNYDQPAYYPMSDVIKMPLLQYFDSSDEYYSVLFHELVHSTGSENRLKREGIIDRSSTFGSEKYSFEELVAEIGANFLCSQTGINQDVTQNSLAYIKNWLTVLKSDKKFIITAATKASQAVDYIRNINSESKELKEVA